MSCLLSTIPRDKNSHAGCRDPAQSEQAKCAGSLNNCPGGGRWQLGVGGRAAPRRSGIQPQAGAAPRAEAPVSWRGFPEGISGPRVAHGDSDLLSESCPVACSSRRLQSSTFSVQISLGLCGDSGVVLRVIFADWVMADSMGLRWSGSSGLLVGSCTHTALRDFNMRVRSTLE